MAMSLRLLNKRSGKIFQVEQLIIAEQEKNVAIPSEMTSLRAAQAGECSTF